MSDIKWKNAQRVLDKLNLKNIDAKKLPFSSYKKAIQERMYKSIIDRISLHSEINENIVIKGGSALFLAYNSQRITPDIDFVILPTKKSEEEIKKEVDGLKKYFLNLKPKVEKLELKPILKETNDLEIKINYKIYFHEGYQPTIRVEGKYEKLLLKPVKININFFGKLLVQQPKEILTEKIVCLFSRIAKRNSIKITDIFDIYYLTQFFGLDTDREMIEKRVENNVNGCPKLINWKRYKDGVFLLIENSTEALSNKLKNQVDKNYFESLNVRKIIDDVKKYLQELFLKIGLE
ncbi:MAG: nucleotidyl transferase AbiEii/AbiGii toxin family protein [Candidatus Micrarchaeota archaeon]|nr:nucleotidyl transferase AbiEii/AbiGii toxin family protein [Candidatus Micrarchaeota archaeon]